MDILIRKENEKDYKDIDVVVEEAFKSALHSDNDEHNLVNRLRKSNEFVNELSLVAIDNEKILGHMLLTKIKIKNKNNEVQSLALAPLSVSPHHQRQGIGKKLMEEALKKSKELGYKSVIVLGHPEYYTKFGFEKASKFDIKAPFEVPDEVFMAIELEKDSLKNVNGVVEYSRAFFEQ